MYAAIHNKNGTLAHSTEGDLKMQDNYYLQKQNESHEQYVRNHSLVTTIPQIYFLGEWCKNEGRIGDLIVFRRECGNAFHLNDSQLLRHLSEII